MKKFISRVTAAILIAMTLIVSASAVSVLPSYIVGGNTEVQSQINEQVARQDTAHQMAELARTLGIDEDHTVITTAQAIWADSQTVINNLQSELNSPVEVSISFAPHAKTNLTAAAFDKILEGTPMYGCGQALYDMEQTTGTNGLFAIGVACSESTYGRACSNNNPFGILTSSGSLRYFDSFDAAIMHFGKLIAGQTGVSSYTYTNTIEGINEIYCPNDGYYWTSKVRYAMNKGVAAIEA